MLKCLMILGNLWFFSGDQAVNINHVSTIDVDKTDIGFQVYGKWKYLDKPEGYMIFSPEGFLMDCASVANDKNNPWKTEKNP